MTQETFHKLTHLVLDSPMKPPANLFAKGIDDWHARARLAHFLAMPQLGKIDEAIELFRTVAPEDVDEENAEDVEEKVFALQKLADLERKIDGKGEDALRHIDEAIELAESTDFLYKYILRGELWGDRWNIMHQLDMGKEAEEEVDERIEAYKDIPVQHVSYLYYGYRFKAMRAAERGEDIRKGNSIIAYQNICKVVVSEFDCVVGEAVRRNRDGLAAFAGLQGRCG